MSHNIFVAGAVELAAKSAPLDRDADVAVTNASNVFCHEVWQKLPDSVPAVRVTVPLVDMVLHAIVYISGKLCSPLSHTTDTDFSVLSRESISAYGSSGTFRAFNLSILILARPVHFMRAANSNP